MFGIIRIIHNTLSVAAFLGESGTLVKRLRDFHPCVNIDLCFFPPAGIQTIISD